MLRKDAGPEAGADAGVKARDADRPTGQDAPSDPPARWSGFALPVAGVLAVLAALGVLLWWLRRRYADDGASVWAPPARAWPSWLPVAWHWPWPWPRLRSGASGGAGFAVALALWLSGEVAGRTSTAVVSTWAADPECRLDLSALLLAEALLFGAQAIVIAQARTCAEVGRWWRWLGALPPPSLLLTLFFARCAD